MSDRPELPIAMVVEQFEITRSTLRRRIENGDVPGAYQTDKGKWLIPVEDLIVLGIPARKTWLSDPGHKPFRKPAQAGMDSGHTMATDLERRVAELEYQLQLERQRREAAEELRRSADEKVEILKAWQRMIEGPIGHNQQATISGSGPETTEQSVKKAPVKKSLRERLFLRHG